MKTLPEKVNPLCVISMSADDPAAPVGSYVFLDSNEKLILRETFEDMHRAQSVFVAHALIQADRDALYSRRESQ